MTRRRSVDQLRSGAVNRRPGWSGHGRVPLVDVGGVGGGQGPPRGDTFLRKLLVERLEHADRLGNRLLKMDSRAGYDAAAAAKADARRVDRLPWFGHLADIASMMPVAVRPSLTAVMKSVRYRRLAEMMAGAVS